MGSGLRTKPPDAISGDAKYRMAPSAQGEASCIISPAIVRQKILADKMREKKGGGERRAIDRDQARGARQVSGDIAVGVVRGAWWLWHVDPRTGMDRMGIRPMAGAARAMASARKRRPKLHSWVRKVMQQESVSRQKEEKS